VFFIQKLILEGCLFYYDACSCLKYCTEGHFVVSHQPVKAGKLRYDKSANMYLTLKRNNYADVADCFRLMLSAVGSWALWYCNPNTAYGPFHIQIWASSFYRPRDCTYFVRSWCKMFKHGLFSLILYIILFNVYCYLNC
jgi:hypothetical protein